MMTEEELNEAYRKVAEESRKIDKMNLRWAEMGPNIHGIKRIKLIPWGSHNQSWFIRPLVIKPYDRRRID